MRKIFTLILLIKTFTILAQNVGINTTGAAPNTSAILDVAANNKGVLIPQVILTSSTDNVTIAIPANSLLVYNTSTSTANGLKGAGYYYNSGTPAAPLWVRLMSAANDTSQAWLTTGNSGTDTAINFLGTIDSMPLRFKLNNTWAGQWDAKNGNYFIGKNAGYKTRPNYTSITGNKFGFHNIAIGTGALYSNTLTTSCIAIGDSALFDYANPYIIGYNIAIGYRALRYTTSGNSNLAIGNNALFSNTTGERNTAIGNSALFSNISGDYNIACGGSTLYYNTTGSRNTVLGFRALAENVSGNGNVAIGYDALRFSTTGDNNIGIGEEALYNNTTADNNIANGYQALYDNTTGEDNIANGYRSLYNNTTGINNIANGNQALRTNTSGNNNVANGYFALYGNTTGDYNNATGYQALYANTSGNHNIANGYIALTSNSTGDNNIGIGRQALEVNTTGNYNTGVGIRSIESNDAGFGNSALGAFALQSPDAGTYNTAVGYSSDVSLATATNATALGYNATAPASNYVRVGNTLVTSIFGAVNFNTSDGRFKTNIQNKVPGLDFIMKLKPVTYHFEKAKYSLHIGETQDADYVKQLQAQDACNKTSSGFIAQEVEQAAKELNYDFDGIYKPQNDKDTYGLGYQQFVVPLVKAVQEQQQMILDLQQTVKQQQLLLEQLQKK